MATILVLDDRPDNRAFLCTLLGYLGHALLEAADAEHALALARTAQPDLVIADVLMPDVDGFEFVRRLRAEPQIAHTRVIFYTAAYMEAELRTLAQACGVAHMLTKPAEPQQVLDVVQHVLGAPAPTTVAPPPAEAFAEEHQRVLLGKLAQKVDELEQFNAELEMRVSARTAELAEANARLSELNLFKDNMLALTSHDLRSPLGAIQNMAELLIDDIDLPEEARHFAQNIYNSSRHLINLVSQMLNMAQLEAGKVTLECVEMCASDVARWVLDSLETTARAKSITTILVAEPGEPLILADWTKMSQILTNLVGNALKFTPEHGRVALTVGPTTDGIFVRVADTGVGIPAKHLPHLFERFRQVHTRGTNGERGTGLGLAIVRQLVQLHGGTIEVASEQQKGSVFTMYLPAAPGASAPRPDEPHAITVFPRPSAKIT